MRWTRCCSPTVRRRPRCRLLCRQQGAAAADNAAAKAVDERFANSNSVCERRATLRGRQCVRRSPDARPPSASFLERKVKKDKEEDDPDDADTHGDEMRTLAATETAVHDAKSEYNRLRQVAAAREEKLEALQVQVQLGQRDNLDADDELAYPTALKGAAESELEAVAFRAHGEDADTYQYEFMKNRVIESVLERKTALNHMKRNLSEVERKLSSEVAKCTELVNACKEAARQHGTLEHHIEKVRLQSNAQLARLKARSDETGNIEEWVAGQLGASYARVSAQKKKEMAKKSKDKGKHGGLEFIGGGKALIGHREQQLEKALERLRMTLGVQDD